MIVYLLLLNSSSFSAKKLELHYFFDDDSHDIDAFIRNNCETEVLAVLKQIAINFDAEFTVETEPYSEGGFKQIYKFIGKNSAQLALLISLFSIVLSRLPPTNSHLEKLQEENLRLDNEQKRINLRKLKDSVKKDSTDSIYNDPGIEVDIGDTIDLLNLDLRIVKHRSNFYSNLSAYKKITKVSTTTLNKNNLIIGKPIIVEKEDFSKFILDSNELPIETDENAEIEIISPVLKKGKYKWKGLYKDQPMEFYMKDDAFKESILQRQTTFKNGTSIQCVVEINKKIDETGIEQVVNYNVLLVIATQESGVKIETQQGKVYKQLREAEKAQYKLDLK